MYGTLNLSLPIYAGRKIKFGIVAAELLEKATKLDLESQKDEVINNTIEAYANLFKAFKAVALVKENLVQAQQREKNLPT
jgi:outer membrane protein TolC